MALAGHLYLILATSFVAESSSTGLQFCFVLRSGFRLIACCSRISESHVHTAWPCTPQGMASETRDWNGVEPCQGLALSGHDSGIRHHAVGHHPVQRHHLEGGARVSEKAAGQVAKRHSPSLDYVSIDALNQLGLLPTLCADLRWACDQDMRTLNSSHHRPSAATGFQQLRM